MCNSPFIDHMTKAGLFHDVWNQEGKSQLSMYQSLQSNRKPFYWDFKRKAQKIYEAAYKQAYDSITADPRNSLPLASNVAATHVENNFRPLFNDFFVNTGLHFAESAYNSNKYYKDKLLEVSALRGQSSKIIETDHYFQQLDDVFGLVNGQRRNIVGFEGNKIIFTERLRVQAGDKITILTKGLSDAIQQVITGALSGYMAANIIDKLLGVTNTTRERFNPSNIDVDVSSQSEVRSYIDRLIRRDARERAALSAITETTAASNMGLQEGAKQVDQDASKIWISRMDGRVRETHGPLIQDQDGTVLLGADGLEVPIGQPYVIRNTKGGFDRLRYPGDTSLGASLSNIINCRCYEQFKL